MIDYDDIKDTHILVVGDVILDRYIIGEANRLSPEAPVPVLLQGQQRSMPGGAANVAMNLAALSVHVHITGLVGADEEAQTLTDHLQHAGVTVHMVTDPQRPTSCKTRMNTADRQIMRWDRETVDPMTPQCSAAMVAIIQAFDGALIILSDYAKGVLCDEVIAAAMAHPAKVVVDPKGTDYNRYRGAALISPNRAELAAVYPDVDYDKAAVALCRDCGIMAVLLTRSEEGVSLYTADALPIHISAEASHVVEVSGAGDSVIAAVALGMATGLSLQEAAILGNRAGSRAVEREGTYAVTLQELTCEKQVIEGLSPVCDWDTAKAQVDAWRAQGLRVGFTNGCFDILHTGHVTLLAKAAQTCDRLIMAINSDQSVKRLKGETRPVNDQNARACVLSALRALDMIVMFGDDASEGDTPAAIVAHLQPDVIIKGGDYTADQVIGADTVLARGGDVVIIPFEEGFSTTAIIQRMAG